MASSEPASSPLARWRGGAKLGGGLAASVMRLTPLERDGASLIALDIQARTGESGAELLQDVKVGRHLDAALAPDQADFAYPARPKCRRQPPTRRPSF